MFMTKVKIAAKEYAKKESRSNSPKMDSHIDDYNKAPDSARSQKLMFFKMNNRKRIPAKRISTADGTSFRRLGGQNFMSTQREIKGTDILKMSQTQ